MITLGSTGDEVYRWQLLLLELGYDIGPAGADTRFGAGVDRATRAFCVQQKIEPTSRVDGFLFGLAAKQLAADQHDAGAVLEYPPLPDFKMVPAHRMDEKFGHLDMANPTPFINRYITAVRLPWMPAIGSPSGWTVQFHRDHAFRLSEFFHELVETGLSRQVISWAGSLAVRPRRTNSLPSFHAYGCAFDINAPENWLGQEPAKPGRPGCLYEIVPVAARYGFYWGGHFRKKDGMHFEVGDV